MSNKPQCRAVGCQRISQIKTTQLCKDHHALHKYGAEINFEHPPSRDATPPAPDVTIGVPNSEDAVDTRPPSQPPAVPRVSEEVARTVTPEVFRYLAAKYAETQDRCTLRQALEAGEILDGRFDR